ncbi:MAG: ABC transporter ATP-binding protein, partial [Actinopolymorphaceae bacterium]
MAVAAQPTGAVRTSWWVRFRDSAECQLLFRAIWQADRRLAAVWSALIVVRAALPPALAVAIGWLVGSVADA